MGRAEGGPGVEHTLCSVQPQQQLPGLSHARQTPAAQRTLAAASPKRTSRTRDMWRWLGLSGRLPTALVLLLASAAVPACAPGLAVPTTAARRRPYRPSANEPLLAASDWRSSSTLQQVRRGRFAVWDAGSKLEARQQPWQHTRQVQAAASAAKQPYQGMPHAPPQAQATQQAKQQPVPPPTHLNRKKSSSSLSSRRCSEGRRCA